jgi:hypothetical protein
MSLFPIGTQALRCAAIRYRDTKRVLMAILKVFRTYRPSRVILNTLEATRRTPGRSVRLCLSAQHAAGVVRSSVRGKVLSLVLSTSEAAAA